MLNQEVRTEYMDFMKSVSRALLLGSVPSSSTSMEATSTASSVQPPDILPPK
jgi:hypothetical protein